MIIYPNAHDAIRSGNAESPKGIAYIQGKGWYLYDPTKTCPEGTPEFLCVGQGRFPIPLTAEGAQIVAQMIVPIGG